MFGYATMPAAAWNSVLVGVLIFATGISAVVSRMGRAAPGVTLVLGLWAVASAWVFEYAAGAPAMWNSIAVGVLVAILARRTSNMARSGTGEGQTNQLTTKH
jgi:hypothetical protein